MIFTNPRGAPELACDNCGCRWVDRIKSACYECGATISAEAQTEFACALAEFSDRRKAELKAGVQTGLGPNNMPSAP